MENFIMSNPWIIVLFLLWTIPWKGVALWKAARSAHSGWFLTLLLLNTLAILDILYIFVFSNKKIEVEQELQEPEQPVEPQVKNKYSKYRDLIVEEEVEIRKKVKRIM